jgi:hypothetical protein
MRPLNVIQVRELLREKFPALRTHVGESSARIRDGWVTGVAKLDEQLGGLPKSAITEVIAPRRGCGSALLLNQLLHRAVAANQFIALVDGRDSFDATALEQSILSCLLWIRCHTADEALKATDLVLRDGNLRVVLLDLALNPEAQLRKIPPPTWYRFQRIIEESSVTCIVFTPRAMISPAQVRVTLTSRFNLTALDRERSELINELEFEISDVRRSHTELLRQSA